MADLLTEKGYIAFLPLYTKRFTIRGHSKTMKLPLFTRYVFCRMQGEPASPVVTTPGVVRLLGFEGGAGSVDDLEIEALRRIVASNLPVEVFAGLAVEQRIKLLAAHWPEWRVYS